MYPPFITVVRWALLLFTPTNVSLTYTRPRPILTKYSTAILRSTESVEIYEEEEEENEEKRE